MKTFKSYLLVGLFLTQSVTWANGIYIDPLYLQNWNYSQAQVYGFNQGHYNYNNGFMLSSFPTGQGQCVGCISYGNDALDGRFHILPYPYNPTNPAYPTYGEQTAAQRLGIYSQGRFQYQVNYDTNGNMYYSSSERVSSPTSGAGSAAASGVGSRVISH